MHSTISAALMGGNKQWLCKCFTVYEDYIESWNYNRIQHVQVENTKSAEKQKTCFPKESVENADLHKLVLNKIMTTNNNATNKNFVAPLITCSSNKTALQTAFNDSF